MITMGITTNSKKNAAILNRREYFLKNGIASLSSLSTFETLLSIPYKFMFSKRSCQYQTEFNSTNSNKG
jgi:hypothetical protein